MRARRRGEMDVRRGNKGDTRTPEPHRCTGYAPAWMNARPVCVLMVCNLLQLFLFNRCLSTSYKPVLGLNLRNIFVRAKIKGNFALFGGGCKKYRNFGNVNMGRGLMCVEGHG